MSDANTTRTTVLTPTPSPPSRYDHLVAAAPGHVATAREFVITRSTTPRSGPSERARSGSSAALTTPLEHKRDPTVIVHSAKPEPPVRPGPAVA